MNTRQRKKRAKYWFSDKEVHNADRTAADFLYCLLTEFKSRRKYSHPVGMNEKYWNYILGHMIWSFDQLRKNYPESPHPDKFTSITEYKKASELYEEALNSGFEDFSKYIGDLWD